MKVYIYLEGPSNARIEDEKDKMVSFRAGARDIYMIRKHLGVS